MTQSDCSAYCDPQTFKTDGSAAGSASLASADTQSQVLCSQCTSQCGSISTTGGGIRKRHNKKGKKTKRKRRQNKSRKIINKRKTNRKRHRKIGNH